MIPDDRLLLGFYGDDFTGSTDALESLARGGVRAVLFQPLLSCPNAMTCVAPLLGDSYCHADGT